MAPVDDQNDPNPPTAAELKAQWERVGDAVKDRRLALGWTQQEAADRSGVSLATWRLVESAGRERFQELTLRGLVRGLGWPVGAIEQLRAGGPAPAPDELTDPAPNPHDAEAGHAPRRRTFDYLQPEQSLPAGFARKYLDLTPEEQGMVQGFMEGLFARRGL
jgi:transcriptional regulator with XRE-family HTH domain